MDRLELGNFRHRKLKLEAHHERIVKAVLNGERKDRVAVELGVDRKTLYHYIKAYVDREGLKTSTPETVREFYKFRGRISNNLPEGQ